MIGLDIHVLVRYIMRDDAKQSPKAARIMAAFNGVENSGYVTPVSMVELVCVLDTRYELTRAKVAQALDCLVRVEQLKIESANQVICALRVFKEGKSDSADCLIERSANSAGCEKSMMFDVNASKHAGVTLIA